jgi:hypothetical protein
MRINLPSPLKKTSSQTKLRTKELIEQMRIVQLKKRICGKQIGVGLYRDVYVLKSNPNYVVKIERDMSTATFANVTEWRNYINNKEWKWFAEWLAPCEMINTNGQVLIQRRVEHRKREDYPKYIPGVFTDLKLQNFGWIGDRFVCCDYSFIPFFFIKVGKSKMKYAKWRKK